MRGLVDWVNESKERFEGTRPDPTSPDAAYESEELYYLPRTSHSILAEMGHCPSDLSVPATDEETGTPDTESKFIFSHLESLLTLLFS
jgi:hypothetical protein